MSCLIHAERTFGSLRLVHRSHKVQFFRSFQRKTMGILGSHFGQTGLTRIAGSLARARRCTVLGSGIKLYPFPLLSVALQAQCEPTLKDGVVAPQNQFNVKSSWEKSTNLNPFILT
jgi:hypothetical protein